MTDKNGRQRVIHPQERITGSEILPHILVTQKAAFRALAISDDLGYALVHDRVIPTVRLRGKTLVPVDELRKMLTAMVQVDRLCRTCAKKDDKGKCAVFASPPSDVENCKGWTFDEMWNVKEWSDMAKYEERKK